MTAMISTLVQIMATIGLSTALGDRGLGPTGAAEHLEWILLGALGLIAVGGAALVTHRRRSDD